MVSQKKFNKTLPLDRDLGAVKLDDDDDVGRRRRPLPLDRDLGAVKLKSSPNTCGRRLPLDRDLGAVKLPGCNYDVGFMVAAGPRSLSG